jgi:hypothetical protein
MRSVVFSSAALSTSALQLCQSTGFQTRPSLDTFWFKDKSLADLDNLPDPKDLG